MKTLQAGMAGSTRTYFLLQQRIVKEAVRHVQARAQVVRADPKALAEQTKRIRSVRKVKKLEELRRVDSKDFELWTAGYFIDKRYTNVVVVPPEPDMGVDVFVPCPDNLIAIVQCKRYTDTHTVGRPFVEQFFKTMHYFTVRSGFIATTSEFTSDAVQSSEEYGKKYTIIFMHGRGLTAPLQFLTHLKRIPYPLYCSKNQITLPARRQLNLSPQKNYHLSNN